MQGSTPRERLEAISNGFIEAKVLLAAAQLRIFDPVRGNRATASEVAKAVGGEERGVAILLDALVSMEILSKNGDRYRLRPEYEPHLVEGAVDWYPAILRHRNRMFRGWAVLEERIRGAREPGGDEPSVITDPTANRDFIQAMYAVGAANAAAVIDNIDLDGVATVADLGGGPGHYLMEMCRRAPEIDAYLLDLPLTIATARDLLRQRPAGRQVKCVEWDFYDAPRPAGLPSFDLIFLSQVVHAESPERNRALFDTLHALVNAGGRLIVHEHIADPSRTTPKEAALFAVNMLAMTRGGRTYTEDEITAWAETAGFLAEGGARIHARSHLLFFHKPKSA